MTVAPATTETSYVLAGTAVGPFATVFPYAHADEVRVTLNVADTPRPLFAPADYTLTGSSPLTSGGTVTLNPALAGGGWAAGSSVTLARATPSGQPSAFGEMAHFSPAAMEGALDGVARQVQDVAALGGRTMLQSVPGGSFDAKGQRIRDAADAIDPADAATLSQLRAAAAGFSPGVLGDFPVFASVTAAALATVAVSLQKCFIADRATLGDGGFARYRRVASQPSHDLRFRSTDRFLPNGSTSSSNGGWWAIDEAAPTLNAAGAVGGLGADASAAMTAAVAALGANGGTVQLLAQDYRLNSVITGSNVRIRGERGVGETDAWPALRPYQTGIGHNTLAIGNGAGLVRNATLENLVISGDDGAGNMAQYALKLSGVLHFYADGLDLRDGLETLVLLPSNLQPVSCAYFNNFQLRNSGSASTSRGIFISRLADPGYTTNIVFANGHINGPTGGYAVEIDGTTAAVKATFSNVYFDVSPGHGIKFTGSSSITGFNVILDPGATGQVVAETNQTPVPKAPTSFFSGQIYCAGQKFKWGDGSTTTFPAYAEWFFRQPSIHDAFFYGNFYLSKSTSFYDTSQYIDMETDVGPWRVNGTDFKVAATTDASGLNSGALRSLGGLSVSKNADFGKRIRCQGGTGFTSFYLDAAQAGGGFYAESLGTDADIGVHLQPKGSEYVVARGLGVRPYAAASGDLGSASYPFNNGYQVNAETVTSDERVKTQIADPDDALIAAAARTRIVGFKHREAVERKGDAARLHIGVIAQEFRDNLIAEGLDEALIAPLTHDAWEDQFETDRATGERRLSRAAGDLYGVRYQGFWGLKIAALERQNAALDARLAALEAKA